MRNKKPALITITFRFQITRSSSTTDNNVKLLTDFERKKIQPADPYYTRQLRL